MKEYHMFIGIILAIIFMFIILVSKQYYYINNNYEQVSIPECHDRLIWQKIQP